MARYSKIGVQVWSDTKFCELSRPRPNGQTLWFYLLTNPARTALPGLFVGGERSLSEGLDWRLQDFRKCWGEIESRGMAKADWRARLVWIPKMVRWDPPNGPNVAKAWGRVLVQMPECQLRRDAEAFMDGFMHGISDAIYVAFRDGIGKPLPMASQSPLPPSASDNHLPLPLPQPSPMPSAATAGAPVEMGEPWVRPDREPKPGIDPPDKWVWTPSEGAKWVE